MDFRSGLYLLSYILSSKNLVSERIYKVHDEAMIQSLCYDQRCLIISAEVGSSMQTTQSSSTSDKNPRNRTIPIIRSKDLKITPWLSEVFGHFNMGKTQCANLNKRQCAEDPSCMVPSSIGKSDIAIVQTQLSTLNHQWIKSLLQFIVQITITYHNRTITSSLGSFHEITSEYRTRSNDQAVNKYRIVRSGMNLLGLVIAVAQTQSAADLLFGCGQNVEA